MKTRAIAVLSALLLVSCGDVKVRPQANLPKPLIVQLPADVGLIIPPETRRFTDKETRYGVDWVVDLGSGEVRLLQDIFRDLFQHVEEFKDLQAAGDHPQLKALFEARVDQYSFVTARETGGRYYAVTIRYRINLYTPQGEKVDSYTLTGYGNSLALGMSGGKPLTRATVAAMRDAAAKFLVQFPEASAGQQLARNEAVVAEKLAVSAEAAEIEAVPIDEAGEEPGDSPSAQPPGDSPSTQLPGDSPSAQPQGVLNRHEVSSPALAL